MNITKQDKERDKIVKTLQKYLSTIEESYINLYDNDAEMTREQLDDLESKITVGLENAKSLTK
ncbi:MAG TPA: hypothetical protein VF839_06635 [Clostridium sp.]